MGFFYSKIDRKKKVDKSETLFNLAYEQECKMCPLKSTGVSTPKMKPTGLDNPFYYMLGEAPGEQEDLQGEQFKGESGQILRNTLVRLLDLDDQTELADYFRWNNCVRCRPRQGKANRTPTEIEIECCRKSIEQDIEKTKPKVILGFGNIPLKWLLKTEGIMIYRGRYVPVKVGNHVCWYFPLLHPSYILRNQRKDKNGRVMPGMYDHIFEKDLERVFTIAEDLPDPKIVTKGYTDGVEVMMGDKIEDIIRIKEVLHELKQAHKVGVDIETRGLRPYNNGTMLCIAIGTFEHTITFPLDHPKAWNNLEKSKDEILTRLMELIEDFFLTSGIKICHNVKFELEWFHYYFGKDVLYKTEWIDTQAYSYLINERTSKGTAMHSLGTQTLVNFGFNLKALSSKVDSTKPLTATLEDLLLYNGMDTKWTVALEESLFKRLTPTQRQLSKFLCDTAITLVQVQDKGCHLDLDLVDKYCKEYLTKITELEEKILADKSVQDTAKFLDTNFNPSSNDHLKVLFETVLQLPSIKKTAGDLYSTDHTVLDEFARQGHKVATHLVQLREHKKLYGTYLENAKSWLSPDGVIHGQYAHLRTSTGRLASSDPVNFQNFPSKKGVHIRNIIYAPKGYVFAAFDQGQIEARVLAMASHDEVFSNAIRHDYDVHLEWAKNVIELYPRVVGLTRSNDVTDKILKAFRKRIKNELVFPWFYKAGKYSVGSALGLPNDVADELFEMFWSMFAGVKRWQEDTLEFYNIHGYVETLTGRRRNGPMGPSEQVNSPIQGTASDIVVESGNRIVKKYGIHDPNYVYVLEIHDDLTFLVPEKNNDDYLLNIAKEMVYPAFDFIEDIPLSVELKMGKTWGKLEEVEVFRTQDFFSPEELNDQRRIQTRKYRRQG